MIDWVTAIIPCHHDEKIYGGTIASVTSDGSKHWQFRFRFDTKENTIAIRHYPEVSHANAGKASHSRT